MKGPELQNKHKHYCSFVFYKMIIKVEIVPRLCKKGLLIDDLTPPGEATPRNHTYEESSSIHNQHCKNNVFVHKQDHRLHVFIFLNNLRYYNRSIEFHVE